MDHVYFISLLNKINYRMMCFTYGKKVRRHVDDEPSLISRVELLKKKFKRLDLVREYFSVKKI